MASVRQYAYPGFDEANKKSHWYSSAVHVGDQGPNPLRRTSTLELTITAGGFHDADFNISALVPEQIDQAFINVDTALRDAGCKGGWTHVYRINSFHIQLDQEAQDAMVRNFKKWMPDNHPVWTCVQVGRLGEDRMRVEIEVSAFDPEGAKEQGTMKA